MRRIACMTLLLLLPGIASAQKRTIYVRYGHSDCCSGNRFSLEPYAGAIKDPYDASADDQNTASLLGFRVGYRTGNRTRLLANVGYSKNANVVNPQALASYYVYDNTWVFTTAGGEFDVVPGRTSAALGLQGGVAWRRVDLDGQVGSPAGAPQHDSGFSSYAVLIPSLVGRHRVSSHISVLAGVHDNIFDVFDVPVQHG